MSTRQHVPEGIEEMHPGPQLCRLLADVDLSRLAGHDLVAVLQAWDRQVAYTQSQWLDAMVEVGTVVPGPDEEPRRTSVLQDGAEHEVRAGLGLSRPVAASRQTEGAALRWRHPALRAALVAGRIDLARAQTCVREVAEADPAHGNAAIEAVLPEARSLTAAEIAARLREFLCAIDPEASARRHEAAVAARRLRGYRHRDGTIDICAENLPPERAAAMSARVDAIVTAVRRAGHPGMVRVLRVDVCSGLLDGSWEQWSDAEIIEHLLADADAYVTAGDVVPDHATPDHATPDHATPDHATPDHTTPPAQRDAGRPEPSDRARPDPGRDGHDAAAANGTDHRQDSNGSAGDLEDGGEDRHVDHDDGVTDDTDVDDRDDDRDDIDDGRDGADESDGDDGDDGDDGGHGNGRPPDPPPPDPRPGPAGGSPPARRGRSRARPHIEVRAALTTLLGRDEHPGEVAVTGMGSQPAASRQVRALVHRLRCATWRIVLTGPDGHLLAAGTTRARPRAPDPPSASPSVRPQEGAVGHTSRAVVEIRVAAGEVDDLDAGPAGAWEPVIAAARLLARRPSTDDGRGSDPRDEDDRDPRRSPDAALENLIRARDRTCVFPGCRAPAHACEIDHSHEWARRGRTSWDNLGAMCASDHRLKGPGGWVLRQVRPGTFTWTAPGSGIVYARARRPLERSYPEPEPNPRRFVAVLEPDDTADGTPTGPPCPIIAANHPPPPRRPTLAEERETELRGRLLDWRRRYGIRGPADTADDTAAPPF